MAPGCTTVAPDTILEEKTHDKQGEIPPYMVCGGQLTATFSVTHIGLEPITR